MITSTLRAAVRRAIGAVRKYMPTKDITKEQEEMLSRIAMAPRMLKKHWRWLRSSGLIKQRYRWNLTTRALFYIEMITQVHGPSMDKDWIRSWYNILRWTHNPEMIAKFWRTHAEQQPRH